MTFIQLDMANCSSAFACRKRSSPALPISISRPARRSITNWSSDIRVSQSSSSSRTRVISTHEICHTPMACATFGYRAATSNADADEFNAVRFLENPYKQYLGMPLRTHYSELPVPGPLVGGN